MGPLDISLSGSYGSLGQYIQIPQFSKSAYNYKSLHDL